MILSMIRKAEEQKIRIRIEAVNDRGLKLLRGCLKYSQLDLVGLILMIFEVLTSRM
jgi:hypothetical protein